MKNYATSNLRLLAVMMGLVLMPDMLAARGVSPYLPLNVSPEIERQFERVLILAGKPVVRRPIPAAIVLDALPEACAVDEVLCRRVRAYLQRYQTSLGITQLQAEVALTAGSSDRAIANAHGRAVDSHWQIAGAVLYQPSDYLLLSAGGLAYQGRAMPTGSVLSAGFDFAQLDVGFRDHWFSSMSTSSMLISTEAPTMPSVTLSNYRPIGPMGFTYEIFSARMSSQEGIRYYNTTTNGDPRLAGVQFGIEPVRGYALTFNKLMQYGGGLRGGASLGELRRALLDSNSVNVPDGTGGQEEFGNQVAAVTGTTQFPGKVPFSVSIEYAGEDNSYAGNYRLGDSALSLGIDFPILWQRFDAKYEVTEWQNVWYTHHLYPLGLTQDRYVLGHWFGDQRQFGDQVGGRSHVFQVGMRTDNGDYWQGTYRTLAFVSSVGFQTVPEVPYRHLHELALRYSTSWHGRDMAAELTAGQDVFGEHYGRLSASIDLTPAGRSERRPVSGGNAALSVNGYEAFVDLGIARSHVYEILSSLYPSQWLPVDTDVHVGLGARRSVSQRNDVGVRLEIDRVDGRSLLSLRALDYRFRLTPQLALTAFAGVGRYDYDAPAFGWYGGMGLQLINVWPKWDIGFDWRHYDKLSRNRVLADDPPNTSIRPRFHFDIKGQSLYLSRKF